ncbi:DNA-binding protein [Pandoraea pnomenusa]|uniref:DNA-binding protein n=1 Tax=Pandoraea pnomenusa TaxID=93220 RepID=UPI0011465E88|nr:DNA-binding protein [Pandoraea pnomenusa]QDH60980.1 DNA-binding protein [Pandoraea pnomenusa]
MNSNFYVAAEAGRRITTAELAQALSQKPQSIRKRYAETGSYYGVRPVKLASRRLLWPADSIQKLISGADGGC